MSRRPTNQPRKKASPSRGSGRRWKWILVLLLVFLLIPVMQVALVRLTLSLPLIRPFGLPIYVARLPSTPFINPPVTLPMLIDQGGARFASGPKHPLLYRWIDLPQIPEMFLEPLWISEDQRFFQHEGFDWKEMDLAVKEAKRKGP
jgi:membrane peptidoglycan carboxypeptidase